MEQIGDDRILSLENKLNSLIQRLSDLERRLSILERSIENLTLNPPPKVPPSPPPKISHKYLSRVMSKARHDYEREHG